jgi:hypothetical protein
MLTLLPSERYCIVIWETTAQVTDTAFIQQKEITKREDYMKKEI